MSNFNAGHLRATITISFTLAIIGGFFMGLVEPNVFMAIAGSAIGFYFAKHDPTGQGEGVEPAPGAVALSSGGWPTPPLREPVRKPIPFEDDAK